MRDTVWVLLDGFEISRGYRSIWHSLQTDGMRIPMTVIDQLVRELDSAEVQERKAHPLKRRIHQKAGQTTSGTTMATTSSNHMGFQHMTA